MHRSEEVPLPEGPAPSMTRYAFAGALAVVTIVVAFVCDTWGITTIPRSAFGVAIFVVAWSSADRPRWPWNRT